MRILVTGGAGYIGSHTCVELLEAGFEVTVFDNFCNSNALSMARVEQITGKRIDVVRGDMRDRAAIAAVLRDSGAVAVIHFAGLKAVGESVRQPLAYYDNNVVGSLRLLDAMAETDVRTLVFSSSATVYGEPQSLPLTEEHPLAATSPYGRSKLTIEEILRDVQRSDTAWRFGILRYFNPVGAHPSGRLGEHPNGMPNNLMPYIAQVAIGRREFLNVWGDDYPTADGTGVRDYIHVVDLALGHLKILRHLQQESGCVTLNLGTGRGYSVLEMVRAFSTVCGHDIPYRIAARRAGDIGLCYADATRAREVLGWRAQRDLATMCADAWRWQKRNPDGYVE